MLSKHSENTLSSKYALHAHFQQRGLLFLNLQLATSLDPLRLLNSHQTEELSPALPTINPLGESLASMR